MPNELDYFIIDRQSREYPAFEYLQEEASDYFFQEGPIREIERLEMRLSEPSPQTPRWGDIHTVYDVWAFGEKLYQTLAPLELFHIQFIPANIKDEANEDKAYWLMHNYNYLDCLDLSRSVYETGEEGEITCIHHLVLSPEKLAEIPLEKRLIFRMSENYPTQLIHRTLVEKIREGQTKGIRFILAEV